MGDRNRYVNVRPYLPHALLATFGVVGLPFFAVIVLNRLFDPDPSLLLLVLAGVAAAALAIGIGLALWKTRPESADIAFGELLIWGWLQRKHADDRLDAGVRKLGLDRSGHPTEPVRISPEAQLDVLQDLNDALEDKDPYTHGHSQRVERHSYRTAAAMGLPVSAIEELRLAAALHDVGKIRVPDRILRKPGKLSPDERTTVEEHVVVGAWMVSSVGSAEVVSAVRHHHERWDGRGYPDGLSGTDIPLYARIIAVADAYDAITSTRPYRVSAGREHAVSVLRQGAGTQFDPMVVTSFVDALPVRLPVAGAVVLLAGPVALGRKLVMWLKRLGAGHLAPAAASLGAVITLGSFVPTPTFSPPASPRTVAQAPSGASEATEPAAEPKQARRARKEPTVQRPAARPALVAQAPAPAPAPAPARQREEDIVLSDDMTRPRPEPKPVPEPQPEPKPKPQPKPEPQPEPEPEPEPDDRNCGEGPQGQGEESSREGRETAEESSDGRGPNHC